MAGVYNFTIEQGTDFARTLTWSTGSPASPVNLTGYSAAMQIRTSSAEPIVSLTNGSGITLGGSAGTIAIEIPSATTSTFNFNTARYDLKLVDGSGKPTRLLEGQVSLDAEVTQ